MKTSKNEKMRTKAMQNKKRQKAYKRAVYFILFLILFPLTSDRIFSEAKFSKEEISFNGFRNPSIGLEYRKGQYSIHGGYYVTNFESNITTRFYKFGTSYWFLPSDLSFDKSGNPSAFYLGVSYGNELILNTKTKVP